MCSLARCSVGLWLAEGQTSPLHFAEVFPRASLTADRGRFLNMDLNAPAPSDDESEPPQESALETYRREREERKLKMKRQREEEESKSRSVKVSRPSPAPTAHTSLERLKAVGPLPEGWIECPAFGEPIEGLIPSKVPLSDSFNELLEPGMRYSRSHVLRRQKALGRDIGMVIDLTNTTRYYSPSEWTKNGVKHMKIACRGRDEVPDPESVNTFVFEVIRYFCQRRNQPGAKQILVHCTHGHNRTGFMIANFLMRFKGGTVEQAIQAFAKARPPGIYKQDYIENLFNSYNERRPETLVCPSTPEWKRVDLNGEARVDDDNVEDDDGIMAALQEDLRQNAKMTNDDVLGDPISEDNQIELQKICCWAIGVQQTHGPVRFPGSQPVSLDRKNLQLLRQKYYYATWKADGTRYMLLIVREGCYLIDRNFKFRRVQLRFPVKPGTKEGLNETQHCTLLDGEMVIDKNPETDNLERRYLVYDVMMINTKPLTKLPFHQRWKLIEKEIIEPRLQDRKWNRRYKYEAEPFRVRRKDFWMLSTVGKLLNSFIPRLSHEADGLIFQGWDDVYVPRTHEGLLKWKYAHMNSVDFLLKVAPNGAHFHLFLMERGGKYKQLEGARVTFPENVEAAELVGKIIECNWNKEEHIWEFMRIRHDKDTPNAYHVYEKVMGSIADNITEQTLFAEISEILKLPMYAERIKKEEAEARHAWAQQQQGRRG